GIDTDWASVSAGSSHTCAIKTGGELYCWGANNDGILGLGAASNFGPHTNPTKVGIDTDWASVSVASSHTCAVNTSSELYCWGNNSNSQLGLGDGNSRTTPTRVGLATTWTAASTGYNHTCAVNTSNETFCWGVNNIGQLGLGSNSNSISTPSQVGADTDWTSISAGTIHTCATKTGGKLYCWGNNEFGQLGLGSDGRGNSRAIPVVVTAMPETMNGESRSMTGAYLATPLASSASVDSRSQVSVAVPVAVGSVTHHEIWRSLDGSIAGAVKIASSVSSTYTDSNVAAGATYYYLLKACSDRACSDFGLGAVVTVPR
nr:hypothetical protein [Pseudomonadota bacterium]